MKFGEKLIALRYAPWEPYYLQYEQLKDILAASSSLTCNSHSDRLSSSTASFLALTSSARQLQLQQEKQQQQQYAEEMKYLSDYFLSRLYAQVETIAMFVLEEQGRIAADIRTIASVSSASLLCDMGGGAGGNAWPSHLSGLVSSTSATALTSTANGGSSSTMNSAALAEVQNIAMRFLRLVDFMDLNLTGIRKILKRHDKVTRQRMSATYLGSKNAFLAVLLDPRGLQALYVALHDIVAQQRVSRRMAAPASTTNGNGLPKGFVDHIRRHSYTVTLPANNLENGNWYSSNGGSNGDKTMRNTSLSTDWLSAFGQEEYTFMLLRRIEAARKRLQESTAFSDMLSARIMLMTDEEEDDAMEAARMESEGIEVGEDSLETRTTMTTTSQISNVLNLLSTFFYMMNYYVAAPGAAQYAELLGNQASMSGMIIGMTSVAALASTVLYSWWTSYSYKSALVFAASSCLIGNLLYASGLPFDSMNLVLLGRLMNGFGSARSINRRYIADSICRRDRTAASAAFVTAGALGMAGGPAMAAMLHLTTIHSKSLWWQEENAPGWFMAILWAIYLVVLLIYFQDPPRKHHPPVPEKCQTISIAATNGETMPLVGLNVAGPSKGVVKGADVVTEARTAGSLLTNVAVLMTLYIYCLLKMVMESSLSSSPPLTNYYFHWRSAFIGIFLCGLGLLMLPANMLVAHLSKRFDDRELITGLVLTMLIGCLLILQYNSDPKNYHPVQFISGSVVLYVSATALEGPNMSLLSKSIPRCWSRGIFNVGLLATEFGTFGRVVADVFLTACGSFGLERLLNFTFGSLSAMCVVSLILLRVTYEHLDPQEQD